MLPLARTSASSGAAPYALDGHSPERIGNRENFMDGFPVLRREGGAALDLRPSSGRCSLRERVARRARPAPLDIREEETTPMTAPMRALLGFAAAVVSGAASTRARGRSSMQPG